MVSAQPASLTLEEFLQQPETKPASEFVDGVILQKATPKGRHSRLQGKTIEAINDVAEAQCLAYAFPELRCTFRGRSLIPDVSVFVGHASRWMRAANL
jgi:Uma2 family endonuclease